MRVVLSPERHLSRDQLVLQLEQAITEDPEAVHEDQTVLEESVERTRAHRGAQGGLGVRQTKEGAERVVDQRQFDEAVEDPRDAIVVVVVVVDRHEVVDEVFRDREAGGSVVVR